MKKRELYAFRTGLHSAKFEHPRVSYAITKNKRLIKEAIDDMEKFIEPDEEMQQYKKDREKLAIEYCEKDKNGQPKKRREMGSLPGEINIFYIIPGEDDEKSKYRLALAELDEKYREVIDRYNDKIKKYNEEFLDDESEFEPFMVELSLMEAHEKCPQSVMDLIYHMIKDE